MSGYAADSCSTSQLGNTRTAGRTLSALASTFARSMPRLIRLHSIAEIVDCGMPEICAGWFWLSSCSSRMIRTN